MLGRGKSGGGGEKRGRGEGRSTRKPVWEKRQLGPRSCNIWVLRRWGRQNRLYRWLKHHVEEEEEDRIVLSLLLRVQQVPKSAGAHL